MVKRSVALVALAVAVPGASGALAAPLGPVSVRVPAKPIVTGNVAITFRPRGSLPHGGYYYAVVVLTGYVGYSLQKPPPCATSSDMGQTVYGFPHRRRPVRLTLISAHSADQRWCPGGTYEGAVYAVPHKPRCSSAKPCSHKSAEYGACWEVEGRPVCGVVVPPKPPPPEPPSKTEPPPQEPGQKQEPPTTYSYPGGLPKPIDHASRVVGRFRLSFPTASGPSQ